MPLLVLCPERKQFAGRRNESSLSDGMMPKEEQKNLDHIPRNLVRDLPDRTWGNTHATQGLVACRR